MRAPATPAAATIPAPRHPLTLAPAPAAAPHHGAALRHPPALRSFLDKVEEMGKSNFLPSTEDILKVRDPTRTIETLDFQYGKAKFRCVTCLAKHPQGAWCRACGAPAALCCTPRNSSA